MTVLKTFVYMGNGIPQCGDNVFPLNNGMIDKARIKLTLQTDLTTLSNLPISKEIIENGKNGETVRYFIDTTGNLMMYGKGAMLVNLDKILKRVQLLPTTLTTKLKRLKKNLLKTKYH